MSGAERTTKIENDHADEEIAVEGSSISSKSEENNEDEFNSRGKALTIQSPSAKTMLATLNQAHRSTSRELTNQPSMPICQ